MKKVAIILFLIISFLILNAQDMIKTVTTEDTLEKDYRYSKYADLVFHILAYMRVNNASDLYDEEYITKMAIAKQGFNYDLTSDIQKLHEYYNENFQCLAMINFLPFYCNSFDELRGLRNFQQFTQEDISYFIEPFTEILDKESAFYFDYWDNLHSQSENMRNLLENYITSKIEDFACFFSFFDPVPISFLSYSLTRYGRGLNLNGRMATAVPFTNNENDFVRAFFQIFHELIHVFTNKLIENINMDDGSHTLSEFLFIRAGLYLVKEIDGTLVPDYIKMFSDNASENEAEFINLYKIDEELDIKVKEIVNNILSRR